MKKILGVIPARLGSTRLPRKMLADIEGNPLIYYTWKQAAKAKKLDALIVATESKEIYDVVKSFGGRPMMTSAKHPTGSDRVAEAARKFKDFRPAVVIDIQGDEPLIPPRSIDRLGEEMLKDKNADMGTIAIPCNDPKKLKDPNVVKTIVDKNDYALYFSRSVIPYPRTPFKRYLSKLGLFAYSYEFLQTYVKLPQTPLELAESLEQLRCLEHGYNVKAPIGNYERVEVNYRPQLEEVRKIIRTQNRKKRKRTKK